MKTASANLYFSSYVMFALLRSARRKIQLKFEPHRIRLKHLDEKCYQEVHK